MPSWNAMVNLNMIDIIGSGIKKMFNLQRQRYFPLPDYDLDEPNRVKVRIIGKIINENYTRLLIKRPDLDLKTVMDIEYCWVSYLQHWSSNKKGLRLETFYMECQRKRALFKTMELRAIRFGF